MSTVFEETPKGIADFAKEIQEEYFPELSDCKYVILFDIAGKKKRWLAKIYKANEMIRHFTGLLDNSNEGLDYIIVLDKLFYTSDAIEDVDRKRIIRHELRHIMYLPEKKTRKGQYQLCKHNCATFWEEIEMNTKEGEPRWDYKMAEVSRSLYEKDEE